MPLTSSQTAAVQARGNVIVVAGAGTGKTSTLVARCLDVITTPENPSSLDRILMVTFTEAAAAEMRHRLRLELQKLADQSQKPEEARRFAEQLALVETAKISTIHSFCLRLVQSHFHKLELDPEVKVLDDQQCGLLLQDTLNTLFEECFAGTMPMSGAVQALVSAYAPDRDRTIRALVQRLHRHTQSLPDPAGWIRSQQSGFEQQSPDSWESWLVGAFTAWRDQWWPVLEQESGFDVFDTCREALASAGQQPDRAAVRSVAEGVLAADNGDWNDQKTKRRKPFGRLFDEAAFLASVTKEGALEADWQSVRGHLTTLLALTTEFTRRFTAAKRDLGGVDFPDLEQLALQLLLNADGTKSEVARDWQARLDFVFVDECQDINSAQDAILSTISRGGAESNRFLVGDVKQSIYRFRLADPRIFRDYEAAWSGDAGQRLPLAENFRSRPGILGFVNLLFPALMRDGGGGVEYEPLQAGQGSPMTELGNGPCVELHLIRKESDSEVPAADDKGGEDELADLSATEREARLVAFRLRELERSKVAIWDKEKECARQVEWRDMAVLMRSPGSRTEVFAKVFHQCGIPLEASRAGFLESVEVSDLVCLLKLLDNPLQDIPLLAVLRSPLVGLTLDELATIRAHNADKTFWVALRKFAGDVPQRPSGVSPEDHTPSAVADGESASLHKDRSEEKSELLPPRMQEQDADPAPSLQARVASFLRDFERWREQVRQVGPSLCLEQVLAETGYDVLLAANERGAQQLANVRRLLDLARQFDPYLRQGLHRFLRFLKALDDAEETLEPAPPPSRNAVRLMSIHKSKGLEFPVVALAGLGTKFNLSDLNELILLDQEIGLTARAMTADGAGRYPTLPFWLAARRQRAQTLAEELRLLYVAMTRARDRLICSGMLSRKSQGRWASKPCTELSEHEFLSAQQPMDWLFSWLPGVTSEDQWDEDACGRTPLFRWELWDPHDDRLKVSGVIADTPDSSRSGPGADPALVQSVADRVSFVYAHRAAAEEPAKSSVTALRRRALEFVDEDAVNRYPLSHAIARSTTADGRISAADRGTLHHRFLERVRIEDAHDVAGLAEQAATMVRQGVFTQAGADSLELKRIALLWSSEVGRVIAARAADVRREFPFTVRLEDAEVRAVLGQAPVEALAGEFVVVQGVADLVVVLDNELWLLDFKTDDVTGEALRARATEYGPQLRLYAMALERIFNKPVKRRWLHFLIPGETVGLE